jgi:hypothetical protein
MKRTSLSRSPSPAAQKRLKSHMPLSDNHPELQTIRGKVERRKRCQELIARVIDILAARLPPSRTVRCGHRVSAPILDRGKTNILTAGRYRQHVRFILLTLTYV